MFKKSEEFVRGGYVHVSVPIMALFAYHFGSFLDAGVPTCPVYCVKFSYKYL